MSTLTKPTTTERPHRRLSLTRPTLPAAVDETLAAPSTAPIESTPESTPDAAEQPAKPSAKKRRASNEAQAKSNVTADFPAPVVRVMAYLSDTEAALLDDLWMQHRRSPQKPSKSDILRAALSLASSQQGELTATLSQQQTNTLSRQRVSKMKNVTE